MEFKVKPKKGILKWCFIISIFNIALFSVLEAVITDITILSILYMIMSNIIIYKVFKEK